MLHEATKTHFPDFFALKRDFQGGSKASFIIFSYFSALFYPFLAILHTILPVSFRRFLLFFTGKKQFSTLLLDNIAYFTIGNYTQN